MRSEFLMLYFSLLGLLCLFGIHLYWLLFLYKRHRNTKPVKPTLKGYPSVTVQLPLYNEKRVVRRLIEAVAQMDWPIDALEIQVLDDSTDETTDIAREVVSELCAHGHNVQLIHRDCRTEYKAGALANGLKSATGEFVAVFDADNIPPANFLKDSVAYFTDESVGMVQARWDFVNRNQSLLCRAQALFLDSHFGIEQLARSRGGLLLNFNGSAGIWRRRAIEESGGWSGRTLTEDLELSFRAQLAGWKFLYLDDLLVPTELPASVRGFRSQQYRWAKGAVETALQMLPTIWRASIPLRQKIAATLHLTHKFINLVMVALALTLVPALYLRLEGGIEKLFLVDLPIFLLGAGSMSIFYGISFRRTNKNPKLRDTLILPFLTSLGVALAVNNTRAVFSALLGRRSEFVRTPKSGVDERTDGSLPKSYRMKSDASTHIEAGLALYATVSVGIALSLHLYFTAPFLATFAVGYSYLTFLNYRESRVVS